jgi:diguanylate cyclase (GGDEF)-like protein
MASSTLRVLWVGGEASMPASAMLPTSGAHAFSVTTVAGLDACASRETRDDAVLLALSAEDSAALVAWPGLSSVCAETAVLLLTPSLDLPVSLRLLQAGVQDVVLSADLGSLPQRVVLAVERKRIEADIGKAHATDLMTGLPNRHQLIEHMSQLLALREREPRPVSLLVLRIDGLCGVEAGHGHESANVVRRKVAVRLRAGLRASDVVASIGADVFAVLLPSMESPADAQHVIDKLVRSVREPFKVAGSSVGLAAHVGSARFPEDGRQPEVLLRHASAAALLGAHARQDAAND